MLIINGETQLPPESSVVSKGIACRRRLPSWMLLSGRGSSGHLHGSPPAHIRESRRFLQAEIDLASTMVGITSTTQNEDHRLRLLEAIQTAVNTVRYFERQIENAAVRERLLAAAAEPARRGLGRDVTNLYERN